jgi:hypothetical protein
LEQYAKDSAVIEAVDKGRAASQRGRYEDTIPAFQSLSPEEQAAFRAGYADPLIAQVQQAPVGTNKARALINDASAAEFPVFAAPGRGDQLGRRLTREQTMYETRNAAVGGSKTADNLADEAALSIVDPSVISNIFSGNLWGAAKSALAQSLASLKGQPASVRERIARALIQNDPKTVRSLFDKSQQNRGRDRETRDAVLRALLAGSLTASSMAQGQ